MTSKQVFEGVLMELNKQNAPSIDLETFNYFFNKAINQYVNKTYNFGVDTDQQRTDDIRVLKTSTFLTPTHTPFNTERGTLPDGYHRNFGYTGKEAGDVISQYSMYGATYEFNLPADYLHLLNCICVYKVNKRINCPYNVGDIVRKGAIKCNADTWGMIIDNLYMRPTYKRPYYYIININQQNLNPTNPLEESSTQHTKTSIPFNGTDSPTGEGVETMGRYDDEALNFQNIEESDEESTQSTDKDNTTPNTNNKDNTTPNTNNKDNTTISTQQSQGLTDSQQLEASSDRQMYTSGTSSKSLTYSDYNRSIYANADNLNGKVGSKGTYYLGSSSRVNNTYQLNINGTEVADSTVVKTAGHRYGNASNVRLEVRYGQDNSVFELIGVQVDYIKTPQFIRLTQEQLDYTEDTSQIMEFPDYICQQILDELVKIIMENASDPRLQTQPIVSQSIAPPAQAQQTSKK